MSGINGTGELGRQPKVYMQNERLKPGPAGITFELPYYDEVGTESQFGITGHAYFGYVGMPYTAEPGVSGTQFLIHAFMPTSIGSPNLAHACANAPGNQLGKEAVEGYSPSNIVLISGNDLDELIRLNEDSKDPARTSETAQAEWRYRMLVASRLTVLSPASSTNLGRDPSLPFSGQMDDLYHQDPSRQDGILMISRQHCKLMLDEHSTLRVVDIGALLGTSVTYAKSA